MLSVATVRSAKGAAGYFAADNYYIAGQPEAAGEWFGKGAEALGLKGAVDQASFEALLGGKLPNGVQLGSAERHRAGIDLTFSLPKSWSLLALVGGDRRILHAYIASVKETLRWAERNTAATRQMIDGRDTVTPTDNLVVALFEHDTSRAQDPQAHVHAIVANATEGPDGKWRVLHNDKLWTLNTLLNAITMAAFRERVEALGYKVGEVGKHGNFEAAGLSREALMAFSTRRQQILAKAAEIGARSPQAMHAATLMTRPRKDVVADRGAVRHVWRESAVAAGLDLTGLIAGADRNVLAPVTAWARLAEVAGIVADRGRGLMTALGNHLGLSPKDPYLPQSIGRMSAPAVAAAHAVASALRHLEQREAAFSRTDILKAALDTGLPVGVAAIEQRMAVLERKGVLLAGQGRGGEMITTAGALAIEHRLLSEIERGQGKGLVYVDPHTAAARLDAAAQGTAGIALNAGQRGAGEMLLSSSDRIVAVQGVAGAGKSSVLAPVARLVAESRRPVLGLAVQNTLVQMLERDTGLPSITVARFLSSHRALLQDRPDPTALADARRALGGAAIFVDEASMLSNGDQLKLVKLANLIGVGRMAFVGDARQLGAVDAGKPFALMQEAGGSTAHMTENLRARGEAIREAAAAAQSGDVSRAMAALKPVTIEAPARAAAEATSLWLALPAVERERTAIYAAGRRLRSEINEAVQGGLLAQGEIGPGRLDLQVHVRVNLTDEELRRSSSYAPGMVVEMTRSSRSQQLPKGASVVERVGPQSGKVHLRFADGTERTFKPDRLRPRGGGNPIQLYEVRSLTLHDGDRIRWTATDQKRGMLNAAQATVLSIGRAGMRVELGSGQRALLAPGDPMLRRLDLAYAQNAHMAQGLTADRAIAVLETRDTRLVNQQTFLVTVTRVRDALTLVVDRAGLIERQLLRNPGGKTSAMEAVGVLGVPSTGQKRSGATVRQPPEKSIEADGARVKPFEIGI